MNRIHIALAVTDLQRSVEDYSRRLDGRPTDPAEPTRHPPTPTAKACVDTIVDAGLSVTVLRH